MMFFFSQGVHPIIGILIFVGMIVLVTFSFTRVWRSGPMDVEEYWESRRRKQNQGQGRTRRSGRTERSAGPLPSDGWECPQPNCRAINPPHGRYCRMCGRQR